ncbi:hypothetical protein LguiB_026727 [Lonicera macranthoides]
MHRKRCKAETEDDRCGENGGRYSKEIKSEVSIPTSIQLTAAEIKHMSYSRSTPAPPTPLRKLSSSVISIFSTKRDKEGTISATLSCIGVGVEALDLIYVEGWFSI